MKRFILFLIILVAQAKADFERSPFLANLGKKAENRYQDMWTLSSWFETQRKIRLMDQWLAMNSSSNPFEFYLSAEYASLERKNTDSGVEGLPTENDAYRGTLGAFATIVGLQAQYTKSDEEYDLFEGSFHLRILGKAQQATNWTLFYGISNRKENDKANSPLVEETFKNQFAGASFTLYFIKYFGVEGMYKVYFEDTSSLGTSLEGQRTEGSVFIDFSFLRVFGTYYTEKLEYKNTTLDRDLDRNGVFGGVRFFF